MEFEKPSVREGEEGWICWVGLTIVVSVCDLVCQVDRITLVLLKEALIDILAVLHWDLGKSVQPHYVRDDSGLTSFPGHPIQVNDMVFLHPDSADTRPPEDICDC